MSKKATNKTVKAKKALAVKQEKIDVKSVHASVICLANALKDLTEVVSSLNKSTSELDDYVDDQIIDLRRLCGCLKAEISTIRHDNEELTKRLEKLENKNEKK